MTRRPRTRWTVAAAVAALTLAALALPADGLAAAAPLRGPAHAGGRASAVTEVSAGCAGQNAEVETATAAPDYVFIDWIGCGGIGFARSTDGGTTFGSPVAVPGSGGGWDPSIAVAPNGTVYVAYMRSQSGFMEPVVAASTDHGATFSQVTPVVPPVKGNWGDRDFLAVAPNGNLYLTWDYGPSAKLIQTICSSAGSCAFSNGDLNAVVQVSTDGGKTWGKVTPVGPNFPRNGGDAAPVVVQPDGHVDVLYLGHKVDKGTYKLHPGHEFFTSSADGTSWPAKPTELAPSLGPVALTEWWIDTDLATDSGGTLYASWDTQTKTGDIGWLSWSSDGGTTWSTPVRVTPDTDNAPHIMGVAGGAAGTVYVGWQTSAPSQGYTTYLRAYSVTKGWLGPATQVSAQAGNPKVWPGDTFGIAPLPGSPVTRLAMSWGSAVGTSKDSEVYATTVTVPGAKG